MFRQISSRIQLPRNSRDLLHAANLRHGTDGFTSPLKEGVLRIFFALKNPTASAGFEPTNLGTKGQHATSRPPKPIYIYIYIGFKTFFYVVRHLDPIASYLPTGLHLGFFHSWSSLYLPSSFSSVFFVLSFVSASTSMLFWVIFLLPFSEHSHTM